MTPLRPFADGVTASIDMRLLALFGLAAISELSLLSRVKRKLDFELAIGSFWREAAARAMSGCGAVAGADKFRARGT